VRALHDTVIFGPVTNREFLIGILQHEVFAAGGATTAFLPDHFGQVTAIRPNALQGAIAAVLQLRAARDSAQRASIALNAALMDWASAGHLASRYRYDVGGETIFDLRVSPLGCDVYDVEQNGNIHTLKIVPQDNDTARIFVDNAQKSVRYFAADDARLHLAVDGASFLFDNLRARATGVEASASSGAVKAPMHGKLLRLHVAAGDTVREGAPLAVIEAMKMEHEITASVAGDVRAVYVAVGEQIPASTLMIEIEPA
jgi:geranyl-CoA carboxylase alpha subunit